MLTRVPELHAPPRELVVGPSVRIGPALAALRRDRGLVRTLAERDLRARYKQSFLGVAWSLVTPLVTVVVFTIFFKRIGKVDTGDVPYPLFAYCGLVPWSFFTGGVSSAAGSLVFNNSIVNKTWCAREVFPIAGLGVAAVDAALAALPVLVLFAVYGVAPAMTSYWVPVILAGQVAFTLGVGLALSVAIVYVRDLRQVVASALQMGLFLTPVAFATSSIPEGLRAPYAAVNPFVGFLDAYRRAVLDGRSPDWSLLAPALCTSVLVLMGGYLVFRRLEGGIADVA